ncbi:hypothetical protein HDV00_001146 [Rhizophlyctis rosea]|nr:hypothetical protein HDV00_001146 [Rhizophlyctis rosea]
MVRTSFGPLNPTPTCAMELHPFSTSTVRATYTYRASAYAIYDSSNNKLATVPPRSIPTSTVTPTGSNGSNNSQDSTSSSTKPSIAVIAGAAAGGLVVLLLIIGLVIFFFRRRQRAKRDDPQYYFKQGGVSSDSPTGLRWSVPGVNNGRAGRGESRASSRNEDGTDLGVPSRSGTYSSRSGLTERYELPNYEVPEVHYYGGGRKSEEAGRGQGRGRGYVEGSGW